MNTPLIPFCGLALAASLAASAVAQGPVLAYSVDSDATDHLWALDLDSGAATDIGAVGFDSVEALAFGPDGRLFGIDDGLEVLITIDLATGAGSAVGPLSVPVTDVGLAFDSNGALWMSDEGSLAVYSVDPTSGAASYVADTFTYPITGLTALGPYLYGVALGSSQTLVRASIKNGKGVLVGGVSGVVIGDGAGLAFDPYGRLWGVEDSTGQIFTLDPLAGAATPGATTITGLESLAIPARQVCAWTVDSDASDHLWLLDLLTGHAVDIGAVGFSDVEALSLSPAGGLFGVDESSGNLITIDTVSGAGSAIGALGVTLSSPGLSFDGSGGLWLCNDVGNPSFYAVNPATGAATLVGAQGVGLSGLCASGAILYGLESNTADTLLTVDPATGAATAVGALANLDPEDSGIAIAPDGSLWGLDSDGTIFLASRASGAAVEVAATLPGCEALAIAGCTPGRTELALTKANFTLDWTAADADTLRLSGAVNPSGLLADLSGATVLVRLGGTALAPAAALDEKGQHRSALGATPELRYKLSPRNGKFSLTLGAIDLRTLLGIPDADGDGATTAEIEIAVLGAGLADPVRWNRVVFETRGKAGDATKGKFTQKKYSILTGAFHPWKSTAKEGATGHTISLNALMIPNGGGPLIPVDAAAVGDIALSIGNAAPINIPYAALAAKGANRKSSYTYSSKLSVVAALKKFTLSNSKGTLTFTSEELPGTGLPAAGVGQPTSHVLAVSLAVQTANGVERFAFSIELERKDEFATSWK